MNDSQLKLAAELLGWTDCILEPWRNPADRTWATSYQLRKRFYAGQGIPWHPRQSSKTIQRTLAEMEQDRVLIGAGQTRGRSRRLTPAGDDEVRRAIGAPFYSDSLGVLAALVDIQSERGHRWTPETILARRLEMLDGKGWGRDQSDIGWRTHLQWKIAPLLPARLIEWTSTIQGHVLYAVTDATPPKPVNSAPDDLTYCTALHEVYAGGMNACRAALRKMHRGGEMGPMPAAVSMPCMEGWDTYGPHRFLLA